MNTVIGRCTCKANVCGIRQSVSQVSCKASCDESTEFCSAFFGSECSGIFQFCNFFRVINNTELGAEIVLSAVCFIAEADYICSFRKQSRSFTKLLNSANKHTAGRSVAEFFGKVVSRIYHSHLAIAKEVGRVYKEFPGL